MNQIQHIAFRCADKNRQEAFYTKHFGFKRARVFHPGTPGEFVMLRKGKTCIELFPVEPEHRNKKGGEQPVGFTHLAFEVPSIAKVVKQLAADGIKADEIVDCSDSCPGLKVCFFRDPDGNRIELMEGWADEE